MKKLILSVWLLSTLAGWAGTIPAFPAAATTFVSAFTNTTGSYNPRGVAVADLFGTGHPALITANFGGNYLTVLTNNGSGVYGFNANLTVGPEPYAVVATNINGSGHVDLICVNEDLSTVSVLTNNGGGGFALSDTVQLESNSGDYSLAVADIYNNGKPAVITASEVNNTLTVYTNAGGGIFGSNATYNTGNQPIFVTAADVNGDGWVDLICANEAGTLTVLTNNGGGGFVTSDTVTLKSGSEPVSVTVADIYNNSKPALISANENLNTLTVYTNTGGGIFGSNATYNVGSQPDSVTVADVNGDGSVDLICANNSSATLSVLTNNGSGIFAGAWSNSVSFNPAFVVAANIFGDAKPDLVAVGSGSDLIVFSNITPVYNRTFTVGRLTNLTVSASGSPTPAFSSTSTLPAGVTLIDNGNGTATFAGKPVIGAGGVYTVALTASNSAGLATQAVTLTIDQLPIFPGFAFVPATTNIPGNGNSPVSFAVADIYNTGAPALITANSDFGTLTVLTNEGGGYFGSNTTFTPFDLIESVQVADVFGTGRPAIIGGVPDANEMIVVTNNGSGIFSRDVTVTTGNEPNSFTTADIFGTGKLALITANYNANTLTVLTNNGTAFHTFATYTVGEQPESVTAVDVNGDGHVDLVCANNGSSTVSVLTNNGSGGFVTSETIALPANSRPTSLAVADIYNNGKPALVTANSYPIDLMVLTNAGAGIFGSNATYFANYESGQVVAADVNNDGYVDLINVSPESATLTILTNNGFGKFVNTSLNGGTLLGEPAESLEAADINGDGRVDLLYTSDAGPSQLIVLTNGAVVKLSYTENATGTPYAPAFASGYPRPSFSGTSGVLPAGLTLAFGALSGKPGPGTAGNYNIFLTETNALGAGTETLAITVKPAVVTPVFTLYTDENIPASLSPNTLLTNDYDLDGFSLSITAMNAISAHDGGIVTNNVTGNLVYTPPANFTGQDTFTYTVTDSAGDTAQGTVEVEVLPPPTAATYSLATDENTPQEISTNALLGYDYDADFTMSIPAVSATSTNGGTVVLNNLTGYVTYTPVAGFTGQDEFTYALADSDGGTNEGLVSVTVYPPPIAVTFTLSTPQNAPLVIPQANVLNNDSDPAGLPLSIAAVSATSTGGGTVSLDNVNANIDYAPAAGFTGSDTLTYTLSDNTPGSGVPGTVQIIVTAAGSPPYNTAAIAATTGSQLKLEFTGRPGQSYYLQSATNVAGPYADVPPSVVADPNGLVTNTIILSSTTPEQFYRIRLGP